MNWKVGDKFVVLPSAMKSAIPEEFVGTVKTISKIKGTFMFDENHWGYRLTDGRKLTKLERALA